jgi:hypothetical protein
MALEELVEIIFRFTFLNHPTIEVVAITDIASHKNHGTLGKSTTLFTGFIQSQCG